MKLPSARLFALALAVGAIASLAMAPASFAAKPPTVGTNCQADGKIDGRGSTFQNNAQVFFEQGYIADVCGYQDTPSTQSAAQGVTDPTVPTGYTNGTNNGNATVEGGMVSYNWGDGNATGSGQGLEAMQCRDDEFGASDIPYTSQILTALNGAASTTWTFADPTQKNAANSCTLFPGDVPPFYPAAPTYPAAGEGTAKLMSFPVAAGSVGIGYNLNGCTTAPTYTPLDIPASTMDAIFQGQYSTWDQVPVWDPATNAVDTAPLAGCSNLKVRRVVRTDQSGTTFALMTYLSHADNSTSLCGTSGQSWTGLSFDSSGNINDTSWPNQSGGGASPCSGGAVQQASGTGNYTKAGSLVYAVSHPVSGDGTIGYGELSNWSAAVSAGAATLAQLQTPASTGNSGTAQPPTSAGQFQGPGTSNPTCDTTQSNGIPSNSSTGAVGLAAANWSVNTTGTNYADLNGAFTGTSYPVCTFTWDFLYAQQPTTAPAGATGATLTTSGPLQGITYDQLRTMYSYFSYVTSPAGQAQLNGNGFNLLPSNWLPLIRGGFQNNF